MAKKDWEDKGWSNDPGNWPFFDQLPGGHEHVVKSPEGDYRTVHVHDDQDVGDAIANGQFTDDEDE